jgi:hypothetical protein
MKRQYLHLSVYSCDKCAGPLVNGTLGTRENEISKETDLKWVGAVCLSCGSRQSSASAETVIRQFPPVEWQTDRGSKETDTRVELEAAVIG